MFYIETEKYTIDGAHQDLPGFDNKYVNLVDYILKITDEIWEQRAVWVIYDTYTEDVLIHSGATKIEGVEAVVTGTLDTLSSFPDRKMGAEAVIWSKDGKDKFFSSHRILSEATNLGSTPYGKATGKKVYFRTIADCAVKENKIYEEWLVRDNLHLIEQLGFDPIEMAKLDQRYKHGKAKSPKNSFQESPNGTGHILNEFPAAALIFSLFENVWQKGNFDKLGDYYEVLATVHAIRGKDLIGNRQLEAYAKNLLSSFPESRIIVDRITCNEREKDTEVACRWKIVGTHSGQGFFGPPSGQEVVIPFISHYIIENGKISCEWMVFDAFDALCQIHSNSTGQNDTINTVVNNKQMVASFIAEMNKASNSSQKFAPIFKNYFSKDLTLNITKPFDEIKGIQSYENNFWNPLMESFPDLENQPYILMGGEYEEQNYVSVTGNFIGTFKKKWLGIPPNNQPTWLRYATNFLIEDGKIVKAWYFFDILDIMRQAGFHFFPNRGIELAPPPPMSADGVETYETNKIEGQKSLDLINRMLGGLSEYDGKSLNSMDQSRFWDTKNMMWYGPSGIGTTRGLKGFEENHQHPFLTAFPSRGMLPKTDKNQFCQLGDGNYAFDFGFPLMYATHSGSDWLGLKSTGKKITLRVLDYWRREGDQLKENWVMIDMIDILEQLGIDVFELLKKEISKRKKSQAKT